jgi:hypothetical protein
MKKQFIFFLGGLIFACFILIIYETVQAKNKDENNENQVLETVADNSNGYEQTTFINSQVVKVIPVPKSITFAGENVPLEYFDVTEALERELAQIAYSHHATLLTIRLSGRYFGVIDSLLKAQGVPEDFKYLCVAESNLQNLISPAKAVGFWQFLTETGKQYGLEINDEVDERYNIEKSTIAACKYLKDSYRKYKSWTLSAASYNTGTGNIDKTIENQKTNDYYDMALNMETSRYLFRIIAYKIILSNPELYGFYISENEKFKPFKFQEITVNNTIENIADFAKKHGTNYKLLKILNPWLRKHNLSNKGKKPYKIKIQALNSRYVN